MFQTRKPALLIAAVSALLSGVLSGCSDKAGDAFIIVIERDGGRSDTGKPITVYRFTVARDGSWEFAPRLAGEPKKGKIDAAEVGQWVKEIEEGGFHELKSDPKLGQADGSFMDITVQTSRGKVQKRVVFWHGQKVAQAIEKKIVELAKLETAAGR